MAEVARVAIETPLPHLDRLFDFSIPEEFDDQALVGARVRVRFHGRRVNGWIIERGTGEFTGRLQPLLAVSGPPVLTEEISALCRLVADRYAGTLADVLRFAVPKRVAAVENREYLAVTERPTKPDLSAWSDYRLPAEGAASWICHPHDDAFDMLAALAVESVAKSRGAILVVPDVRDVRNLHTRLTQLLPADHIAVVSAEASARIRYRTHLEILAGGRPVAIGTRSAVFAPVPDLDLIAVWDDGDDVLSEPQTPGWHAREVAALRAWHTKCRVVVGGYVRTAATAQWIADGRAADARLSREQVRQRRFDVQALHEPAADERRIPGAAFRLLRSALESGVALVQVPRSGGATGLLCEACGHVVRCSRCGGGVRPDRQGRARCKLCHEVAAACLSCGGTQFLGIGAGARSSADQLRQAFPGVPVVRSDAEAGVLDTVEIDRGIVVATPGAEPDVAGGYAGLLVLDTEVLLSRGSLRAREEAARRWMAAIAKTADSATSMLVAPQDLAVVQALVRNDLAAFAETERVERAAAHMPPAWRCVRLRGAPAAVEDWLDGFEGDVLGPLETTQGSQALLLAPLGQASGLLRQVQQIQTRRSMAGDAVVEVRVDPVDLGDS